jgi:hypothetical protein
MSQAASAIGSRDADSWLAREVIAISRGEQ